MFKAIFFTAILLISCGRKPIQDVPVTDWIICYNQPETEQEWQNCRHAYDKLENDELLEDASNRETEQ